MKKLMKKIKSNSFISKAIAILTISMVLLSSLTISSFAADDEVSAANDEADSITDVWTDVMNWITSSLTSAQGVFLTESGGNNSVVLDSSDIFEVSNASTALYLVELPYFDASTAVEGDSYTFSFLNQSFVTTYYDSSEYGFVSFRTSSNDFSLGFYLEPLSDAPGVKPNTWYLFLTEPFSGSSTLISPFAFAYSLSLTFLGTLAVIGVAIAIVFLLLSVISRFLRLRG